MQLPTRMIPAFDERISPLGLGLSGGVLAAPGGADNPVFQQQPDRPADRGLSHFDRGDVFGATLVTNERPMQAFTSTAPRVLANNPEFVPRADPAPVRDQVRFVRSVIPSLVLPDDELAGLLDSESSASASLHRDALYGRNAVAVVDNRLLLFARGPLLQDVAWATVDDTMRLGNVSRLRTDSTIRGIVADTLGNDGPLVAVVHGDYTAHLLVAPHVGDDFVGRDQVPFKPRLLSAMLNPHVAGETVLITDDGCVHLWDVLASTGRYPMRSMAHYPLQADSEAASLPWRRASAGFVSHPRTLAVASHAAVWRVDLREPTKHVSPWLTFDSAQLASIAAESGRNPHPFRLAVSTDERVALYDVRSMRRPLLSWSIPHHTAHRTVLESDSIYVCDHELQEVLLHPFSEVFGGSIVAVDAPLLVKANTRPMVLDVAMPLPASATTSLAGMAMRRVGSSVARSLVHLDSSGTLSYCRVEHTARMADPRPNTGIARPEELWLGFLSAANLTPTLRPFTEVDMSELFGKLVDTKQVAAVPRRGRSTKTEYCEQLGALTSVLNEHLDEYLEMPRTLAEVCDWVIYSEHISFQLRQLDGDDGTRQPLAFLAFPRLARLVAHALMRFVCTQDKPPSRCTDANAMGYLNIDPPADFPVYWHMLSDSGQSTARLPASSSSSSSSSSAAAAAQAASTAAATPTMCHCRPANAQTYPLPCQDAWCTLFSRQLFYRFEGIVHSDPASGTSSRSRVKDEDDAPAPSFQPISMPIDLSANLDFLRMTQEDEGKVEATYNSLMQADDPTAQEDVLYTDLFNAMSDRWKTLEASLTGD